MLSSLGIWVSRWTSLSWPEIEKTYGEREGLGAGEKRDSSVSKLHLEFTFCCGCVFSWMW